jgi:hypothetical protein
MRDDLLNNYADQTLNYCTAASNSTLHDSLDSTSNLVKEKELDFVCSQLYNYKEKDKAHNRAHASRHQDEMQI